MRIKQWLEPPVFAGDEETTVRVRVLNTLFINFGAGLLIFIFILVPFFAAQKIGALILLVPLFIGLVISRALIFRGRVRLGSSLIILLSYLCFLIFTLLSGGSDSPGMFFLSVLILITGFFFNVRAANGLILLTVLIALGAIFLEKRGLALPRIFVLPPLTSWLVFAAGLVFMTSVRDLILRNLENALAHARQENSVRQQVEKSLRESESRYKSLFENNHAVMLIIDPDAAAIVDANPAACAYYGWNRAELLAMKMDEINTLTAAEVRAEMQQASVENRNHFLFKHRRADGSIRDVEVYSGPLIQTEKTLLYSIIHDITERKHSETALVESQALINAVFDSTADMIWSVDPVSFGLLTFNHGLSDYFLQRRGLRIQTGMRPEDLFPSAEFIQRWHDFYQQALKEGPFVTEYIAYAGSNTLQLRFNVLQRDDKIFGISVFGKDITERKRAEEALRGSEASYRGLFDTVGEAIYILDRGGHFLDINMGAASMYAYPREVLIGKTPEFVSAPGKNDLAEVARLVQRAFEGEPQQFEFWGLRSGGEIFPKDVRLYRGEYFGQEVVIALARDITERANAEERIRQSEKKYRELFQVNKDGIAIFPLNPYGPPGAFVELNTAAHQMLGYTREEMLNLYPHMLEPDTAQMQQRRRQSELMANGVMDFETILLHKNGHPVHTEFTTQVINFEGRPAVMNIVRDVSERKQREKELLAISSLSAALRTAPTRAEMLPVIVAQLGDLLHSDSILAEIIDPLTGEAVVEAVCGAWTALIGFRQAPGTGLNAVISATRLPYHNNHVKDDPRSALLAARMESVQACAGVPLIAQDQLVGFLWVSKKIEIAEAEVRLLSAVADIAANALYRATLHEQARKDAADLSLAYDTTLEGWVHALEMRDQETKDHTSRVVQMTIELARALGMAESELENIRRGALLHDIGKMQIPDSILLKPGTLNDREWEIMRRHPEYAFNLLSPIKHLQPAIDIPYCHHEKWDGSGYPRGLKGEEIPQAARIFALVDVWDALRSDRPYRSAWSVEKSREYIQDQIGKHFAPDIAAVFLAMVNSQS
jgi:PAS domain S-box-containing protein/putative nucleotidyltransferase with HDIG domain